MGMPIQYIRGVDSGNYTAPRGDYEAHAPNRPAVYFQDWRGYDTFDNMYGLQHYPVQQRLQVSYLPNNQIYLQRNPPAYATSQPIPIGDYVLSLKQSVGGLS